MIKTMGQNNHHDNCYICEQSQIHFPPDNITKKKHEKILKKQMNDLRKNWTKVDKQITTELNNIKNLKDELDKKATELYDKQLRLETEFYDAMQKLCTHENYGREEKVRRRMRSGYYYSNIDYYCSNCKYLVDSKTRWDD